MSKRKQRWWMVHRWSLFCTDCRLNRQFALGGFVGWAYILRHPYAHG